MDSPYKNKEPNEWLAVTKRLIAKHPLSVKEIKKVVLESWEEIFRSKIGKKSYHIGRDIFPKPQIMGFFIEIKTSSNPQSIFGNRSYAQEARKDKKSKAGYYLAINFEKFTPESTKPKILKVRLGWLDHEDWMGQKAATGQQSRLSREVESFKLIEL